jgi:hypothetical protein
MTRAVLLGLVVVLGAGEAAAQRLPFTWDVPKVIETVEVPGVMKAANGVPVKIRSVKSAERPEVIIEHLVERFHQWEFYIAPGQKQYLRDAHLTALDTKRLISYTFIVQPNPDGSTTVVMGEANLSQRPEKLSPIAPVFPGAQAVVTSDLEVARTLTYQVPASSSTPDVAGFYRQELTKLGYTETEPNIYRNGTDELQVSVSAPKDGKIPVLIMRRTSTEDSRPPDAH